ncbi:SusD/RagB family nutrient-binding outer membrane lipoprotein [Sphingobacterium olei]|uniref:SusD/RagB family nutrient-binding outer membrane lipoprotein n=1 Tax=Sphingobacterium olei TaxID=2571155 RepID=A0A4U0P3T9_9SPHI|nr:SusD/RagB family nutrient-binding outer membrane lipoprotein [Sphingobacterium olei]TJZ62007.1 SusD/RagB family nutrient-binding outer membrane lipoprotein [Sphingobacterium olei]
MKKVIKYSFYSVLLTVGLQSCSGYFDDLADNPNQVVQPTLPSLLSTSTYKIGINSYSAASAIVPFVQYTASPAANGAGDTYQTQNFTSLWDALYFAMADANEMKKVAVTLGASEYLGVANLMIAYNLAIVNDYWGSAPFSQAFDINNFYPQYDSEEAVYESTLGLIDEAIAELSKTGATMPLAAANDLVYNGPSLNATTRRELWLKFAYAIKARLVNKLSKQSNYDPTAVLDAVDNSFTSNDEDAGMGIFNTRNNWAGVSLSNINQSLGGWLSEQLIEHLDGTTYGIFDPRLPKITDLTVDGIYIGTVNGAGNRGTQGNTRHDENYISRNSPWTSDEAPLWIVTYAELKFIEAEAALAAGNRPRAYAAYLTGIGANMDKLEVAAADKATYLASPLVAVGESGLTLELIFKEKYIATYLNAEAWNDARRHDYQYKDFTMPENAALETFIRRLDYPQGEANKNGQNVPTEVPRSTRLWWD